MSISEQVKELREYADILEPDAYFDDGARMISVLSKAADTIEALSAKLAANETDGKEGDYILCADCKNFIVLPNGLRGSKRGYCELRNHNDVRRGKEKACKHFSANMERSEDFGGWIPCNTEKMPHGGSSVLIRLKSTKDGITGDDDRTYDISFLRTTDNEWVSTQGTYPFDAVLAWKPIEPYHEP